MRFILYLLIFAAAQKIGKTEYTKASNCVSEFVYKGQTYTDCTEVDSFGKPWCSLDANYIQGSDQWRYCTQDENVPDDIVPHLSCVIPFVYENTEYNKCTKTDADYYWCSKTKIYNGEFECCPKKANEYNVPDNIKGPRGCQFPFIYKNEIYTKCTKKDNDKYWCSLKKICTQGGKDWTECKVVTDKKVKRKWIVIQRRINNRVSFERGWHAYKRGFGHRRGNFWLGNDKLHHLTKIAPMKIRFDLWDKRNVRTYAVYSTFYVASESDNYRLTIGGYSGNAGDAMKYHNNMEFSTKDRDNDKWSAGKCAVRSGNGGWWFNSCYKANLNAKYYHPGTRNEWKSILWNSWVNCYSLKKVVIRIAYK